MRTGFHTRTARLLKDNKNQPSDKDETWAKENQEQASSADELESLETSVRPTEGELTPRPRDASAWTKRSIPPQRQQQRPPSAAYTRSNGGKFGQPLGSTSERRFSAEAAATSEINAQNTTRIRNRLPSPKELKKYLDQYSIGQEKAKKHFSVAIYNHCVRMEDRMDRQEAEYAAMELEDPDALPSMFEYLSFYFYFAVIHCDMS